MSYTATFATDVETKTQTVKLTHDETGAEISFPLKDATALIEATLAARKTGYELARTAKQASQQAAKAAREAKKATSAAKKAETTAARIARLKEQLAALETPTETPVVEEQPAAAERKPRQRRQKATA